MREEDLKKLPAYYIVEKELEALIGKLKPNDKLPTEKELMEKYSVSRTTIRTALSNLSRRGLIIRKAGKGTFVSPPRNIYYANILKGFSKEMIDLGHNYSSVVIAKRFSTPDKETAKFFGIKPDEKVFFLARVRYMENIAVAYQEAYINSSLGKELEKLCSIDFNGTTSLYQILDELGFTPDHAEEELKVEKMSRFVSKLLNCEEDSCALSRTRRTYDALNRPLEFVRSFYRGDQYIFRFTLSRQEGSDGDNRDLSKKNLRST